MEITDDTKNKLEIAQDLIRQLYKNNLISDAYIIGSVGRGVVRKESDIDVNVINQYRSDVNYMENSNIVGFKELGILANKYGFNNILDFSLWIEDNNLADALGIKGEEDDEDEEIIKEDKNSRKYRSKVLALKILQLPDVQKELKDNPNISIEKWQEWARKARYIEITKNDEN